MNLIQTKIPGCFEIRNKAHKDSRGQLVKFFHEETFQEKGLHTDFPEVYYSISKKNVLRGLHLQVPPHHHIKVVLCLEGTILDVVVDLRIGSPTFGEHIIIELNPEKANMLYIPEGCAHGFLSLEEKSIFFNQTSTMYSEKHDVGIRWNSCGIEWPIKNPIVSKKDKKLIEFGSFNSPFRYQESI